MSKELKIKLKRVIWDKITIIPSTCEFQLHGFCNLWINGKEKIQLLGLIAYGPNSEFEPGSIFIDEDAMCKEAKEIFTKKVSRMAHKKAQKLQWPSDKDFTRIIKDGKILVER